MPVYSHSRISCFEQCPMRFKYKYIDKAQVEIETTIEAFVGSLVHGALEKLYKDLRFFKLNTLEDLLAFYNAEWDRNWSGKIALVRKEYTPENYRKMGEAFIRNYYEKNRPFDQSKTVGLEQKVMVSLDESGRFRMQGYIDRLAYCGDGVYEIHDYKTSSSMPLKEYLESDRQLALYALAVMRTYPNAKKIRLIWHFLSFGQDVVLEKTGEELERLRLETLEAIKKIESAGEFPPGPSKLCDWCEFRVLCPEQAHIAKTESLPKNEFLDEPGVSLVNMYADAVEKKRELDEKLEKIKEALLEFSRKEGVSNVAGSDCTAKIWSAEKLKFPARNEAGREELEEYLMKTGLWKDVSSLDVFALSKLMDNPPWPEEFSKKIIKFGRKERIEKIYLRKKESDF